MGYCVFRYCNIEYCAFETNNILSIYCSEGLAGRQTQPKSRWRRRRWIGSGKEIKMVNREKRKRKNTYNSKLKVQALTVTQSPVT